VPALGRKLCVACIGRPRYQMTAKVGCHQLRARLFPLMCGVQKYLKDYGTMARRPRAS
jgi:hypothetical protein